MNYEEKYKEVIELIKRVYNQADSYGKQLMEKEFPELYESEDERIRKYIIWHLKHTRTYLDNSINNRVEEAIAWLEKKSCKVDVLDDFSTEFERQISHLIASSINKEWEYTSEFVKWTANALLNYAKHELEKQGEQDPSWSEEDEANMNVVWNACRQYGPKYQSILGDWLKSLKPQENLYDKGYNDGYSAAKYNRWKPSEEQMKALETTIHISNFGLDINRLKMLESLYNDIKKL